jgi:DNA-directed RNA polymerase subunit RPC12/RpoP
MSFGRGGAQELLTRGLAAAQSGNPRDRDEAVFYLEWVTRDPDVDREEEIQAWYWLSRLADDPVRRRDCLENVLALQPSHPDARRDLAIMDGRLKPEDVRDDPYSPVKPATLSAPAEIKRFPCPKCGANITFDPAAGLAKCQFCGAEANADGTAVEGTGGLGLPPDEVNEQDWVAAIHTDLGHAWAIPTESAFSCQSCGATVSFPPAHVSGRCAYCASAQLVKVAASSMGDLREPDGVVPFTVGRGGVLEAMGRWLEEQSRRIGIPDDLRAAAVIQSGMPLYVPFWTFDIAGEVEWSGMVRADMEIGGVSLDGFDSAARLGGVAAGLFLGDADLVTRATGGLVAKHYGNEQMTYAAGTAAVLMNDILVPATRSLPADSLGKLTFDLGIARPYSDDLLASWPAEVYTVSMADASLSARVRAMDKVNDDIQMQANGTSPNNLRCDRRGVAVMSYKLLLLPVWVVTYRYRERPFRALINGQTAQVTGETPFSNALAARIFKS